VTELRHANRHFIVGVIILAIGVVLLLDQLGMTEITKFWPLILIYFGVNKFSTSGDMNGRFWGGFLTLLGVSFQLEELGVRGVRFGTIWPVFLICVGVLLILRRYEMRNRPGYYSAMPPPPPPAGPPDAGAPSSGPSAPTGDAAAPDSTTAPNTAAQPAPPGSAVGAAVGAAVGSAVNSAVGTPPPGTSASFAESAPGGQGQPPPPPNYGSAWDRRAWRQQQKWDRFQQRMERMSERANRNWDPGAHFNADSTWHDTAQPLLDEVHVFWGGRRRIVSKNFMGGDIVAIFGGFEIDLTQADFQTPEVDIEVVSIFGGGEIRIPTNWEVIVESVGIFGGTHDRTWHPSQAPNPASAAAPGPTRRLIIKGVSIFGGLTIKN